MARHPAAGSRGAHDSLTVDERALIAPIDTELLRQMKREYRELYAGSGVPGEMKVKAQPGRVAALTCPDIIRVLRRLACDLSKHGTHILAVHEIDDRGL